MSEIEILLTREFEKFEHILQKQNETIKTMMQKIDQLMDENENLRKQLTETQEDVKEVKEEAKEDKKELQEFYKQIAEEMLVSLGKYIKSKLDKTQEGIEKTFDEKIRQIAGEITDEEKFKWLKDYIEEIGGEIVEALGGNDVDIRNDIRIADSNNSQWHKNTAEWLDVIYKELKNVKGEVKSIRDPDHHWRDPVTGQLSIGAAFRNAGITS